MAAWHERWDHDLRSHLQWFIHEVFGELATYLNEDPTNFMPERERPRKCLRPVTFKDMQISAANSAGADFNESCLLGNIRPRNRANYRLRARTGKSGYADLFHCTLPLNPRC
jgi:hypothetical protein